MHEASSHPGTGFIGVEPFVNSMAKMMTGLAENPLANLRVYDDDATQLLDWLPDASLSGIDLLYPDPWPKKKHWKRRFVSPVNLDRFSRVLKSRGIFRFASDIDSYVNWTLLACAAHGGFAWEAADSERLEDALSGLAGNALRGKGPAGEPASRLSDVQAGVADALTTEKDSPRDRDSRNQPA